MRIQKQFNQNANSYKKYSIIQEIGAKSIIKELPSSLGSVLDLGSGDGRVYKELLEQKKEFKSFYAFDFSQEMLKKHPKDKNCTIIRGDFNSKEQFKSLQALNIDTLISSSALQWAKDLDAVFLECSKVAKFGAFFIFTAGTFKSLHDFLNVKSPIYSAKSVESAFLNSYKVKKIEKKIFTLEFKDNLQMLRYIKKSGVSGGGFKLSYKEINRVLKEYPKSVLEFETMLLVGES